MTVTTLTTEVFQANYKAAEARAVKTSNGFGVTKVDRIALTHQRLALGLSYKEAGQLVADDEQSLGKHTIRFREWEIQMQRGRVLVGAAATGESVGKALAAEQPFDGRIKSRTDVQPAFNRACVQLVRIGITDPSEIQTYVNQGLSFARSEQKTDLKAERLVKELQIGDLTREQVIAVLEKVKKSF